MAHFLKKLIGNNFTSGLASVRLDLSEFSTLVTKTVLGDRHSSVVLTAPTILQPWVQIPSTPSTLFSICIIEIVMRKEPK